MSWLGREDSNLRITESKSDHFSFEINAHSEKNAKFDPLSTNRLQVDSECGHTTNTASSRHTLVGARSGAGASAGVWAGFGTVSGMSIGVEPG
jgi:hypothetical protein